MTDDCFSERENLFPVLSVVMEIEPFVLFSTLLNESAIIYV